MTEALQIQTAKFVDYSDVVALLKEYCDEEACTFDMLEFEANLGQKVTWGTANRTLVSLSTFCDAIRETDSPDSDIEPLVRRVAAAITFNTYIDMEN